MRIFIVHWGAMYQMLRLTIPAVAFVLAVFPTSAQAQVTGQIMLTQKHVEQFSAAARSNSGELPLPCYRITSSVNLCIR